MSAFDSLPPIQSSTRNIALFSATLGQLLKRKQSALMRTTFSITNKGLINYKRSLEDEIKKNFDEFRSLSDSIILAGLHYLYIFIFTFITMSASTACVYCLQKWAKFQRVITHSLSTGFKLLPDPMFYELS